MKCEWRVSILQQFREHLIDIPLLVDEYYDGAVLMPLTQKLKQAIECLSFIHHLNKLSDICGSNIPLATCDFKRFLENLPC
eukprot:CAMPEP_0172888998 /NCGR_PEP_ID=MMETSP1075-20121228/137763_1 /TAXON_ID=2916 /ORGANISM="Ceratium fusus, Strain PA161109" /LENGTH=80 /DNA_ID=CAMNT_0013742963 /DNA_START=13 /DNA_END=252 /DNA_ORIENTATION=+